jgi:hypothetical protein
MVFSIIKQGMNFYLFFARQKLVKRTFLHLDIIQTYKVPFNLFHLF